MSLKQRLFLGRGAEFADSVYSLRTEMESSAGGGIALLTGIPSREVGQSGRVVVAGRGDDQAMETDTGRDRRLNRSRIVWRRSSWMAAAMVWIVVVLVLAVPGKTARAQENPLGEVHTQPPPPPPKSPEE